jgi:hypothetical protein
VSELSHSDVYNLLDKAINKSRSAGSQSAWVRDVYETYFVYRNPDGKLYQRTYSIDATQKLTLGDPSEVVQVTTYAPVATTASYSLTDAATFADAEAPVVIRSGLIFEAGEYDLPTGKFSMSEDELAEAVAEFSPVPVDLDHHKTVLDGKLGQLQSVRVEGKKLFGDYAMPRWLNDAMGTSALKVSCTWDRATKRLKKLALTDSPRLSEAALFSAYAEFAGRRHSASDLADMQTIHDLVAKQGAECAPAEYSHDTKKEKSMSIWDKIKETLTGATPEEVAEFARGVGAPAAGTVTTPPTTEANPEVELLKKKIADQDAAFAQLASERRAEKATAKVDGLIAAGKLYPSERATAIASFARAMEDDERDNSLVTFSAADGTEQKATRAAVLEAQYAARPAHNLTKEEVAAFAVTAGTGSQSKGEDTQKQVDEALKLTPEGRAALADRKK